MSTPLRYGLIGCGGFGRFCLEQYKGMPQLQCAAVADLDQGLARRTAAECGVEFCEGPSALLQRGDIDIVHLATPPFTHASLAMEAIRAGKNVLCEKPLATSREDAARLVEASREQGVLLAVNLMMRYSPLCRAVKTLIDSKALGDPLHAHFINDAKDEFLPPEHWFWDRERSGGIFIEHGVHFFDLFEWWFGPGKVIRASQTFRPGADMVDQVDCTVRYGEAVMTSFYHGFHQAQRRDRQEWRIAFELGTLYMREWVPTSLEIDFFATDAAAESVKALFDRASLTVRERLEPSQRHFTSRGRARTADARFYLYMPPHIEKQALYGLMLRSLMEDQVRAVQEPGYRPLVNEITGVTSLAYALEAQRQAEIQPG